MDRSLEVRFSYHAPKPEQVDVYNEIRNTAHNLAKLVVDKTPASREQSLALTKIEEAVMWANAGLARSGA